MINKRGSALIWILIILILVVIGVVAYFLFFGGADGGGIIGIGSSIPTPPPLPE